MLALLVMVMMLIVYYKPEQVEVVLSLKAALYGTVIATYTVANNIACINIVTIVGWWS